jgi:signal peptidase I
VGLSRLLIAVVAVTSVGCGGTGNASEPGLGEPTRTVTSPSPSMEPTIHCAGRYGCEGRQEDRLAVANVTDIERGDILLFRSPSKAATQCGSGGLFVKRVIGLPAEQVSERNGSFYIDGKKLDESAYIKPGHRDYASGTWTVPEMSYFVVGDNRLASCDSRRWGSILRENIRGKVVAIQRGSQRIDLP